MAHIMVYLDRMQLSYQSGKSREKHLDVMSRNLLSLACRLKEELEGEITTILLGQKEDGIYLREALAAGCSQAVLAQPLQAGQDAYLAAALAARAGGEILLMGDRALDGGTSYLGAQVSELLHMPHVSGLSGIISRMSRQVIVQCSRNSSQDEIAVEMPCLFTVGEKEQEVRPLSVEGILQAFEKEIQFVAREEGERLACSLLGRESLDSLGCLQVYEEIAIEESRSCEIIHCIPQTDGTEVEEQDTREKDEEGKDTREKAEEGQNAWEKDEEGKDTREKEEEGQNAWEKPTEGNITYADAVRILQERWKERGIGA